MFNPKVSLEVKAKLTKIYGLDKPLIQQYLDWLRRIVRFDFGVSLLDGRRVIDKIKERIPLTLFINLTSLFIIFLIALPLGIIGALKKGSGLDRAITVFVFVGFSFPSFWLALLLMQTLAVHWQIVPVSGLVSVDFPYYSWAGKVWDLARHLVLPIFVSTFGALAGISRYVREEMHTALSSKFIILARAKGLPQRLILLRHALRNALLPVITILGLSVPGLLGGSVIFETIFSLPGMGRLFYEGVMARDYPLIMGLLVIGAVLTLLGNLLADIGYALADPRIRYEAEEK